MAGKMLLPHLGGAAAVWTTCVLFFQFMLLLGYVYAHLLSRIGSVRKQMLMHVFVLLLPFAFLPIRFGAVSTESLSLHPSAQLLLLLTTSVAVPFFVVSATAPLVQNWFSQSRHESSSDPYFLYSASNAGSLLALMAYPFIIEPHVGVTAQTRIWAFGYRALLMLLILTVVALREAQARQCAASRREAQARQCAASRREAQARQCAASRREAQARQCAASRREAQARQCAASRREAQARQCAASRNERRGKFGDSEQFPWVQKLLTVSEFPSPDTWNRLYWLAAAFVPSALMLAVTNHIAANVGSVPFLWIVPLALYLLAFIFAFARRLHISSTRVSRLIPVVLLAVFPLVAAGVVAPPGLNWIVIGLHLLLLYCVALLCHTRLAESRPDPQYLTDFYFWIALGGVLGGLFTATLSPLIFNTVLEYPLIVALLPFFRVGPPARPTFTIPVLLSGAILVTWLILRFTHLDSDTTTVALAHTSLLFIGY